MTQVGILGAGITGLTAAHALRKAGFSVTVYDAAPHVGGVIRSHREGGWLAELGPNTILDTSPRIGELLADLGLTPRRLDSNPDASARYVVRDGRPVPLPISGPRFFTSPLFSWKAKLRLLREPFLGRTPGDPSVADFVRHRLGQEFLDYAIDPLVTGIYAGDPAALSIRHAFHRIHDLEARYGSLIRGQILGARERRRRGEVSKASAPKFSFDHGLQVLPDALHASMPDAVRLEAFVTTLNPSPSGWMIAGDHHGALFTAQHQAVLFCGTAHSLARLQIPSADLPSLAAFADIPYPPVTSVVLGFRRDEVRHDCLGFGMLIPHREGFGILGTIFSSSLFPRRAPDDHLTLTTYVGGVRRPEVAGLPDDELIHVVRRDLGRLLGVAGQPRFQHIARWPRAIPQYILGYDRFLHTLDALESRLPGFFVAGHFRDGVALSDAIQTGARIARRIATHFAAVGVRPDPGGPVPVAQPVPHPQ
ncbi:MAG: protoporphyrinogen oxidase [Verrucomicrobiae bacterium]|nr:protoporphyrinogen oxidase [Verrucomicrobiae bacterium]